MKKILSLFLSFVLVLSVCVGDISVSASGLDDAVMIEKTTTLVDMTTNTKQVSFGRANFLNTFAMYLDGVRQNWLYIPSTANKEITRNPSVDSATFGYDVIKLYCEKETNTFVDFIFDGKITPGASNTYKNIGGKKLVMQGRLYNTSTSTPEFNIFPVRSYHEASRPLKANTWYTFSWEITPGERFVATYTEELQPGSSGETPDVLTVQGSYSGETVTFIRHYFGNAVGETTYLDAFKSYYEHIPYNKAKILSVGTNGVVDGGQNVISMELSESIPEITKDHITVKNSITNEPIAVDRIVASDGTEHTLDVILASNLTSWSEYDITIDALAFGEGSKQRTGDDDAVDVTDITESFETSKPPFATKGFDITQVSGYLKARGLVVNTTGTPKDMKLVFSTFDANGRPGTIVPTNYDGFNNSSGEYVEASVATAGADKFSFFIIDNWVNKTPLLGTSAMVDASGNNASDVAVSGGSLGTTTAAITADELDHTNIKLSIRIDTKQNGVTDGILFVYKKGETLSDTNPPIYAEAVSTAADGTLSKVIPLIESLDYGEYTVEFVSKKLGSSLTDDFNHYTAAELLEARRNEIFADAKLATTAAELKEILLGLNSNDEEVNSNFDIFGSDADMTNYENAYDKENVFTRMLIDVSGLADYDALVNLFEQCSADQIQYENENPTIMIESLITTVADTTNTVEYGSTRGNYKGTMALTTDGVKNHWMYIATTSSQQECYEVSNDTSFGSSVVRLKKLIDSSLEFFFGGSIPSGGAIVRNSLDREKGTIEGKIRFTQSVKPRWTINPQGGIGENVSIDEPLKANTWYTFKWDIVTGSYIKVSFTEDLTPDQIAEGVTAHQTSKKWDYTSDRFTSLRFNTMVSVGESVYLDDIKIYHQLIPYEKAKINSVGTAGVVNNGQNIVSMELSQKIPELTANHIRVTNKETNEVITANSIAVSGETTQTVGVNLESNLAGWSEYTITIDAIAFGENSIQRVGNQEPTEVTKLTYDFVTIKPPFASRSFVFTNIGDTLNAKALVSNTSGEPKSMQFVFSNFDESGRNVSVVPTEHLGFSSSEGAYLEANTVTQGANRFNFFVIDNWTNRNPLFGANYTVSARGEALPKGEVLGCEPIGTSGAAMELGEFDYSDTKIVAKIDTKENKVTDGIIFVYKNGEVLSATNPPSYAKAVSTSTDGTLTAEIMLPKDIAYAGYIVEFVSDKLSGPITKTFRYYSPDEILENKRAAILADVKVASSAEGVKEVLMGVNSVGEKVNDNFSVFGTDADMRDYNKNIDKLNVFTSMLPSLSGLADYDALVDLFEACASSQRASEVASQKLEIVNNAKQAANTQSLRQIILGVDANGVKINDNFDVISSNANTSVYKSLKNQAAVFNHMFSSISGVSDYNSLIVLFENTAYIQQSLENQRPSTSSNNTSFGGSSTAIKETVNTPAQKPGENTSVSASVFTDMGGHWAQNYVEALYKRGIMKGYEDSSFRGNNSITRAELAKTIVEAFAIAAGEGKAFNDVTLDSWYSNYVAIASGAGIVNGFEDGTFGPDMSVTRQDAVLMIYRALSRSRNLPIGYTFFTDERDIALYASGATRTLGDLGIVSGDENKQFKPNNPITRAEIATIICRALDYVESH